MKTAFSIACIFFCVIGYSQTASVRVNPSSQRIEPDSTANVRIRIQTVVSIHAYSMAVTYDPTRIQCVYANKSNFFPPGGSILLVNIDSTNGRIRLDEALIGIEGRSGDGNLVELRFKGIANGSSQLRITNINLRDTLNQAVACSTAIGTVYVGEPNEVHDNLSGDVNEVPFINYPNPFNETTTLFFADKPGEETSIVIYSTSGQRVQALLLSQGGRAAWNARDDSGVPVASGMYVVRMRVGKLVMHRKILLIR